MKRPLLVLALVFVAVFAATYAVTSATGNALAVGCMVTVAFGIGWIVAHDLRRGSWPAERRAGTDAAYLAAAVLASQAGGHPGSDCPSGFDGFGGGADCGGFGA